MDEDTSQNSKASCFCLFQPLHHTLRSTGEKNIYIEIIFSFTFPRMIVSNEQYIDHSRSFKQINTVVTLRYETADCYATEQIVTKQRD